MFTMNRTAYIHIGMPKAGSTALQMTLSEARLPLSKEGILYPGDSVDHAVLCAQFHPQGEKHFYLKRKNITDSKLQCESILREIQGFSGDIILSSEYLCSIGAIKSNELKEGLINY